MTNVYAGHSPKVWQLELLFCISHEDKVALKAIDSMLPTSPNDEAYDEAYDELDKEKQKK